MRALVIASLLATACGASSAIAADRGYSINDFDRIRVDGPYDVQIHVGPAAAVHAHGSQSGIDRLDVSVNDGTLIIRTSPDS
jgi:Putative auto-transporter adhesin, head GIN domain